MRLLRTFRLRLRSLFRGARVEHDLDAELRDHLERQIEQHVAAGFAPAEARRAALRDFGSVLLIREQCRDTRRVNWIDDLRRDVVHPVRSMRRAPAYTAAAALSLALAIGANTAIVSLVNVLVPRPLPVAEPHELLEVIRVTAGAMGNFSYPFYERVRDQATVFSGVLAVSAGTIPAAGEGLERPPLGRFVSGNFFQVLGLSPAVGRLFVPANDLVEAPHGGTVAVISHGLWQRRFGGDPTGVGRPLNVDGVAFTVAGVLPRTFAGLAPAVRTTSSFRSRASRASGGKAGGTNPASGG